MPKQRTIPVRPQRDRRVVIHFDATRPTPPPQERASRIHHSHKNDVRKGRRDSKHKGCVDE